jgi:hypothetical protein
MPKRSDARMLPDLKLRGSARHGGSSIDCSLDRPAFHNDYIGNIGNGGEEHTRSGHTKRVSERFPVL